MFKFMGVVGVYLAGSSVQKYIDTHKNVFIVIGLFEMVTGVALIYI